MWQLEGVNFRKELRDRFYELAKVSLPIAQKSVILLRIADF
jgi:hypothetical protein